MKKTKLLLGLLVGVSLTIGLASCDNKGVPTYAEDGVLTSTEKLTMQAATGLKLLSETSLAQTFNMRMKRVMSEDQINEVKQILPSLDLMFENDNAFKGMIEEGEFAINESTYQYKETITFKDVDLKYESYVMYYNVDASYQDIERDDNEDEIETFSRISGVASYDNETFFTFISFTETESEGDEIEEERTFRINLNEGSYVLIEESKEQERHENETEFEYTFIDNYKKVLNYSIEVEHEGHKDSIEYEINDQEYEILKQGDIYIVKIGEDDDYHDEIGRFKKVINEDNTVTFEYIS